RTLAAVVRPDRPGAPTSAADSAGGSRLAAYALAGGAPDTDLVLVLAAERRDPADHAIAGVAAVLLSLLTGPYQGASDAGRPAEREVTARPGWTLGVSGPVAARDLPAADAQAAGALRRAVANRTALARHRAAEAGLAALVDSDEAHAYARARLAPIADSPALT